MKHEYVRAFITVPEEVRKNSDKEELEKFITTVLSKELSKEILKHEHVLEKEQNLSFDSYTNNLEASVGLMIVNPKDYKDMLRELEMYRRCRQ